MKWMTEAAKSLAKGTHPACQVGHDRHEHHIVDIDLHGRPPAIPDYPGIPDHLQTQFKIGVWDHWLYNDSFMYCQGDDAFAKAMDDTEVWESFDTLLWLDRLLAGDGIIIDFGANAGWYSLISAAHGHECLAIEADPEIARILQIGTDANDWQNLITVSQGWIDENSPVLPAKDSPHVRLVKADVEGQEDKCMYVCRELFEQHLIDYAMIEVTPSFRDNYPDLIRWVQQFGCNAYVVPDKTWAHGTRGRKLQHQLQRYENDPLGCTHELYISDPESVQSVHQITVMFERNNI